MRECFASGFGRNVSLRWHASKYLSLEFILSFVYVIFYTGNVASQIEFHGRWVAKDIVYG